MISPRRAILFGFGIGVLGALGQVWLIRLNTPQTAALRGLLSMSIATLIGVAAGRIGKEEGVKLAGLAGFIAGVLLSAVGFSLLAMNPALAGPQPFASVESSLLFVSSVMAGTVISSWIVAAVAVLVALPFSRPLGRRESE